MIVKFELTHKKYGKYYGDLHIGTLNMYMQFVPAKEGMKAFEYDEEKLSRVVYLFRNDTVCIKKGRLTLKINCKV